ncbi:MAG: sulfotransferase [Alteraurantiacibacter sp.]
MSRFTGRYVFVAGLHRTGTSLVARLIAEHQDVAAITQSPAPEDEGVYLQGAIAHTARHGIPAHYATDPAQHHIEGSRYDTQEVQHRLEADWNRWFEPGGTWRVEKSPVNLTRMRLYQQLFPMSQFVIVLRHPEAMAAALAKWSDQPAEQLIDYALAAYELAMQDARHLHAVLSVRYEDLVADAKQEITRLDRFLSLQPHARSASVRDGNEDYIGCDKMNAAQEQRAMPLGYLRGLGLRPSALMARHPLRETRNLIQRDVCN